MNMRFIKDGLNKEKIRINYVVDNDYVYHI